MWHFWMAQGVTQGELNTLQLSIEDNLPSNTGPLPFQGHADHQ